MRKFLGVLASALIFSTTMFVGAAGASATVKYVYTGSTSPDAGTCGPPAGGTRVGDGDATAIWANDTFTRTFNVEKMPGGNYLVLETFTKGTFNTLQGPSPNSCLGSESDQISANVKGHFRGNETMMVTGATSYDPTRAVACGDTCTTSSWVAAAFGPDANGSCCSQYFFEYTTTNRVACAKDWVYSNYGGDGDIATVCAA